MDFVVPPLCLQRHARQAPAGPFGFACRPPGLRLIGRCLPGLILAGVTVTVVTRMVAFIPKFAPSRRRPLAVELPSVSWAFSPCASQPPLRSRRGPVREEAPSGTPGAVAAQTQRPSAAAAAASCLASWDSASSMLLTRARGITRPDQRRLLLARHPGYQPKVPPCDGP